MRQFYLATAILGMLFFPLEAQVERGKSPRSTYTVRVILDPIHQTTLSSEVASTVKSITRKMGEVFQKEEILMELDDEIFQAQYLEAKAETERSETAFKAKKRLFQGDSASLLDLKEAEANFASSKAALTMAQRRLNACTIKAPYDGKIVDISVEVHELVQPGDKLIHLVDDSILVAKFLLPSTAVQHLKLGLEIKIKIHETGQTEVATISRISAVIDAASSTIKADAEIDNSDGRLRTGMIGRTTLTRE